jgi:selenophosphate synthase
MITVNLRAVSLKATYTSEGKVPGSSRETMAFIRRLACRSNRECLRKVLLDRKVDL